MESEKNFQVLFVDDEKDFLDLASRYFETEERIDLTTVTSSKEALEIVGRDNFDAIISDYMMPEMNGIALLENLRNRGVDVPFIILTGKGREEVAMEALNKGADRYYTKGEDYRTQFKELTKYIVEEVIRKKSEEELKAFQTWIKDTLKEKKTE